jgi:DNA-binding IclR family transcriptional regulator
MTSTIVAVVIQDGYAFVSTNDGNAGMSVSALARLCGVPRSTIRDYLTSYMAV